MALIWMTIAAAVTIAPTAAEGPAKAQAGPVRSDDRIVCRTTAPTGSLIANRKECRTKREWAAMRVDTMHPYQGGSCSSAESGQCY